MRIAVACSGLNVSRRLDTSDCFTCYNVDRGVIKGCQTLPLSITSTEDVLELLRAVAADVLICGAISADDANEYCEAGVEVLAGVDGSAKQVATDYVNNALSGAMDLCGEEDDD
ncbi:MAG: hypothetical protein Q4E12_04115 [Coriobacteriia bacterium]|nr:hypothetical protein [Coriobacteriia bacterium]